ncbi:diaminopimelate epimerase [Candidatus Bathyarchaeota archaeon]|nr:diaminopimelate epimerase [Candidatus Bathyarchaeota archaeon]
MQFSKYHGTGNDFILLDNRTGMVPVDACGALAKDLCRRHFSIGADGIILVEPSTTRDVRFSYFNADGSVGEMCGNGIRCFAKYLHDKKILEKEVIDVETLAGLVVPRVHFNQDVVTSVTVDMGAPILEREKIPVAGKGDNTRIPITVKGESLEFTAVSMGNPHAVFFRDEISVEETMNLGPVVESHPMFPNRVNVEFIRVISPVEIDMLVYERGCGMTLACGTGACASVVAGSLLGHLDKNKEITVHLQGGDLFITYDGSKVLMRGPSVHAFDGVMENYSLQYD